MTVTFRAWPGPRLLGIIDFGGADFTEIDEAVQRIRPGDEPGAGSAPLICYRSSRTTGEARSIRSSAASSQSAIRPSRSPAGRRLSS